MGLLNLFKLEKLIIESYDDPGRGPADNKRTFVAMYNPTSLKQSYGIKWAKNVGLNASDGPADYQFSKPAQLYFDLILDGTGVEQMGVVNLFSSKTVKQRVSDFLDATYDYHGTIHEPRYLTVKWGLPEIFKCRLLSVDVTYTSFDRGGDPLRAELKVSLISDEEKARLAAKEDKQSSDLTHSRMLRAGDTLPLLTLEIYGSSAYYLDVARFNNIDDFRNPMPGQQVLFPPLEQLTSGR